MYDAASRSDATVLQRAVGELRVVLRVRDGHTVLDGLRQAGCLKARFPRPDDAEWSNVVTLNTSGGVAGGDRAGRVRSMLQTGRARDDRGAGGGAVLSRAAGQRAVAACARASRWQTVRAAEWLPQETILFDRCALRPASAKSNWPRTPGSSVSKCWCSAVPRWARWCSRRGCATCIQVRRGGGLLLHDAIRLDGEVARLLQRTAIAERRACGGDDWCMSRRTRRRVLDAVRAVLPDEAAASAWNGMLVDAYCSPATRRHCVWR